MTAIGLIGAGVMGSAIARRLLAAGFSLRVHDRNPPKLAALAAHGALPATTPAEAARGCPFVILSLNDAAGIRAVTFGAGGIASVAGPETLVIDMSSIDPTATRALAAGFAAACGGRWLDAPLSGGAPGALAGRLAVMAGGTSADFEAARAVMDDLAARFTLMGGTGAGQAAKLANQLLCGAGFAALAEASPSPRPPGSMPPACPKHWPAAAPIPRSCASSAPSSHPATKPRPAGSTTW